MDRWNRAGRSGATTRRKVPLSWAPTRGWPAATATLVLVLGFPGASAAQEPPPITVQVRGTAYDSVAMRPLEGAVVRLVPAEDPSAARVVVSREEGRFTVADLPSGRWLATMLHPALDSLGVEPPVVRLDVREAGEVALSLAIPSPRTLAARRCGSLAEDTGLLYGIIRTAADESPLAGAAVSAHWPEWVIEKKRRGLRAEMQRRLVHADSLGRYALCGVPSGSMVRVEVAHGADSSGSLGAEVPAHGLLRRDLTLGRAEWVTELVTDTASGAVVDTVRMRRGAAMVRGEVRDINGRPVPNALVRVLGSGRVARTGEAGSFVVNDAAAGTQTIEARAIGFQPGRQLHDLRDGGTTAVSFTLSTQTVLLDTVRVMAGRAVDPLVADIERRWRTRATGTVLGGDAVRARSTVFVTDALRAMNGIRIVPVGGMGQQILMQGYRGECAPVVWLDGAPIRTLGGSFFLDDLVVASDVAAMEVYPRASSVPAEFSGMNDCGAVVVWTYRRLGGVAPRDPRPAPERR